MDARLPTDGQSSARHREHVRFAGACVRALLKFDPRPESITAWARSIAEALNEGLREEARCTAAFVITQGERIVESHCASPSDGGFKPESVLVVNEAGAKQAGRASWSVEAVDGERVLHAVALARARDTAARRSADDVFTVIGPAIVASYHRRVLAPEVRERALLDKLSEAQQQVARLLVQGYTEVAIAQAVHKSPHTVHDHVKRIYSAFGVTTRLEMALMWHGLMQGAPVGK